MALSELKIKALKPKDKRYFVGDGQGLYIAVMPTGEKYWYYRTWENGRETKRSLGRYPDISLKQARELKYSAKGNKKETPTVLADVAEDWFAARCAPALCPRALRDNRSRLEKYILRVFGERDILSITPPEIAAYTKKIQETKGLHVGLRVNYMLSRIFRYAIASGICEWNPAAQIADVLVPYHIAAHRSTIQTEQQARSVMKNIDAYPGNPIVRLGLLLLAYTFVRSGEMRLAEWSEVDFTRKEWRIPAARMKMKREHIVPLSAQAVALFSELREVTQHPIYCFVLPFKNKPMATTSFANAMVRMGYGTGTATPHSFRGMASTLLNEHGFAPDVIERQLAHAETNAVRAAYNRAEYMEERRKMMDWWGNYLDCLIQK